jgi:hypothetical protein
MNFRSISVPKALNNGLRRQDGDRATVWTFTILDVTLRRRSKQSIAPHQVAGAIDLDEAAVGQRSEFRAINGSSSMAVDARSMQLEIDLSGEERRSFERYAAGTKPRLLERIEPVTAAFGTRSVAYGERDGFVQKEQLRVAARRHDHAAPVSEFEETSNPTATCVLPHDHAVLIVKGSAAVVEPRRLA